MPSTINRPTFVRAIERMASGAGLRVDFRRRLLLVPGQDALDLGDKARQAGPPVEPPSILATPRWSRSRGL